MALEFERQGRFRHQFHDNMEHSRNKMIAMPFKDKLKGKVLTPEKAAAKEAEEDKKPEKVIQGSVSNVKT